MKQKPSKDERIQRAFMKLIEEVGYLYFCITMDALREIGVVTDEHYKKFRKKK